MKRGDKEKKILYVVAAIAIVLLGFFLGYRNINKKTEKVEAEVKELQAKHKNYLAMQASLPKYEKGLKEDVVKYDDVINHYNSGYSQEYALTFVKDVENATGVWLSHTGFAQTEQIYTFGNVASSNPYYPTNNGYVTDYKGYKTTLSLTYEASYDDYKVLIDYINNYKFKCSIDSISSSYNADSDIVSGTISLSIYSIMSKDRNFNNVSFPAGMVGTPNIFSSEVFFPGANFDEANGDNIISDHDFVITCQNADTGRAVAVGPKGDTAGVQTVVSKDNQKVDVTIRVFQDKAKNYFVQYSVGDAKYPVVDYSKGDKFVPGENLSILVVGSARVDDNDLAGAKISIVNETDKPLAVKYVSDDSKKPRCEIVSIKGEVVEYK